MGPKKANNAGPKKPAKKSTKAAAAAAPTKPRTKKGKPETAIMTQPAPANNKR